MHRFAAILTSAILSAVAAGSAQPPSAGGPYKGRTAPRFRGRARPADDEWRADNHP